MVFSCTRTYAEDLTCEVCVQMFVRDEDGFVDPDRQLVQSPGRSAGGL